MAKCVQKDKSRALVRRSEVESREGRTEIGGRRAANEDTKADLSGRYLGNFMDL